MDETWSSSDVEWIRGASVTGWVKAAAPVNGAAITIRSPLDPTAVTPQDSDRGQLAKRRASPDDRGFFELAGLAEGTYLLEVALEGFSDFERLLHLGPGEAKTLGVLELLRPRTLEVVIRPPLDLQGEVWNLTLQHKPVGGGHLRDVSTGPATVDGRWRLEGVALADYTVRVRSTGGDEWYTGTLSLTEGSVQPFEIDIELLEVRGTLSLGDAPLVGRIGFSGPEGSGPVWLGTDEEGSFEGSLPGPGRYRLEVRSEDPSVQWRGARELEPSGGRSWARLDLRIPNVVFSGEVVTERGDVPTRAFVEAFVLEDPQSSVFVRADADGRFALHGVPEGSIGLTAQGVDDRRIKLAATRRQFIAKDGDEFEDLVLVVKPARFVEGRIVGPGGPIAGAAVRMFPIGLVAASPRVQSGADGTFSMELPEGAREIVLQVTALGASARGAASSRHARLRAARDCPGPGGWRCRRVHPGGV